MSEKDWREFEESKPTPTPPDLEKEHCPKCRGTGYADWMSAAVVESAPCPDCSSRTVEWTYRHSLVSMDWILQQFGKAVAVVRDESQVKHLAASLNELSQFRAELQQEREKKNCECGNEPIGCVETISRLGAENERLKKALLAQAYFCETTTEPPCWCERRVNFPHLFKDHTSECVLARAALSGSAD